MTKKTTYRLLPAQGDFLFGMDMDKITQYESEGKVFTDVCLYQGGVTCKKSTAEWLSPTGWKTMDKLSIKDKMAVYYPEDNTIRFEHPKEVFVWDADEWFELDSRSIHQINCPNHRMYTIKDGKPHIQSMLDYYEEHQKSKYGHRGKFITTFNTDGDIHINEITLRLAVAFQADGYYLKEGKKWLHAFHYKKERKRKRLEYLLNEANLEFNTRRETDGYYRTFCSIPLSFKEYPIKSYQLDKESLLTIVDEVKYWDGSIEKTNESYYTNSKTNADFIQFAYSAAGYKSTIYTRKRKAKINNQKHESEWIEYRVKSQKNNIMPSYCATRNKNIIKRYKAQKGEKKYCPSTSTKLWLCREFGRITVTGNSGKTFSGSLKGLYMALMWDGCLGLVGASSDDLLRTTTMQKYLDHMDNIGLKEGVHWWWENRKTVIKFKNGSAIRFRTLSDWTQLMSTEFTWIEFEEASFLPEIVFKKLITRLREAKKGRWKNYYRSLFMHTNPQGKRGWLYKYFRNPKTRIDGYRCIIASTRENHHLGDTYVSMLEDLYSEDEINEMIEGLDVETDDSTMFPSFDIDKNVVDGLAYDPSLKLILTCDFNVNPMCWYLAQETNDGIWHVIREFIGYDVTTRSMIETVSPIIESYGTKELIICGDAAGKARKTNGSPDYAVIISYLSSQGFDCTLQVQAQNPDVVRRLTVLKRYIKNAKGIRRLLIDSSCEKLIYNFNECTKNLTTGKIKEPTDAEIRDDKEKIHIGHPIDAVSYPIWMRDALRDAQGTNSD